LLNFSDHIE